MIKDNQESSSKFKKQKNLLKILLGASLVVFLFVFISVINILLKDKNENDIIRDLANKSAKIEQKNKELKKIIDSYKTETSKERMARESLNMMLEGENVVVINDNKKEIQLSPNKKSIRSNVSDMPNINKWLHFFFYKKN